MADLGIGITGQQIQQGMNTAVLGGLLIFLVLFIMGLFGLYMWYKKYNKIVVVRKIVNGGVKIFNDKCRYVKDKEGVEWYKFLSLRKKVKIPPNESIDTTIRGLDHLECFLYPTGELVWCKTKIENNKYLEQTNNLIIEPFTTEDRQTLQYQFWKANLEGGINWKDLIIPLFGILALVVIVVSLMIFYKDMGEPLLAMADKVQAQNELNLKILEKMEQIINQTSTINIQQPIPNNGIVPITNPSGGQH